MLLHQFLGERLARLYLGGGPGGAEDSQTLRQKPVGDAGRQGCLRPDDGQVNLEVSGCLQQRLDVFGFDIQILGEPSRAGIARSGINPANFGALGYLPYQRMLPGPTPNNQYFQILPP